VAKLVSKDTYAAVLRFDGVIADPEVRTTHAHAAEVMRAGAIRAIGGVVCIPAVLQMASLPWAPPPVSSPSPA